MSVYSSYQSTDLPWIKGIPRHWNMVRNGALLDWKQHKVGKAHKQFDVLSLTTKGVRVKDINDARGKVPTSYESYQEVLPKDMVFCLFDLDCSAVFSGKSNYHGMITSAYDVATPVESAINPSFLDYWFSSVFAGRHFKIYSKSVRYTINWDIFKAIKMPVPPREEQDQIVRYLDWQVSKINKLIAAKKKQILLLTAKKQTVVSDAITHGLNPKAAMKYSGIEWLGDIPAHWKIVKLRSILSAFLEKGHPKMQLLSVVREQGVIIRDIEDNKSNHNFIPDDLSGYKVVRKNQFIMNKMKAWQGSYGISQYDGIVSPAYFVFNVNFKNLEYFHYAIRSKVYVNFFAQASGGIRVGQWDLSIDKMKDIPFLLPPKEEQTEIVKHISMQLTTIEKAILVIQSQIDTLHELRTRLISDVVTGQIDVRGIKVPDFEMVEEANTDESHDENETTEEVEEQEE